MKYTVTPDKSSVDVPEGVAAGSARERRDVKDELVSSPISQTRFLVYPRTIKVKRPFRGVLPVAPVRSDSQIQGFSTKSRGRLRFVSTNASHILKSQFCMTYHNVWPISGREFKRQINLFLTCLRKKYSAVQYLWIGEFQTRGCPHLHLFLNIPVNDENREWLAVTWNRIADPTSSAHLAVHSHQNAFISWDMGTGSYLCKYLDKAHQKAIPEGFSSFGRWWGNSRGLIPEPEDVPFDLLDERYGSEIVSQVTGEISEPAVKNPAIWINRQIGKYHERVNKRSWFRCTGRSTSCLTGTMIYRQLIAYLERT